ncbi:hypothetical protein HDU85_007278 [Gaertneriomyces sp. JEL0708]|nr:hypothetical protein HDU85_007278 [Gaertneriomyces sp. JEL0708]
MTDTAVILELCLRRLVEMVCHKIPGRSGQLDWEYTRKQMVESKVLAPLANDNSLRPRTVDDSVDALENPTFTAAQLDPQPISTQTESDIAKDRDERSRDLFGIQKNLNVLNDEELTAVKEAMNVTFEQNKVGPQDPGYKYDMQQYFAPAERSNDWDEDSDVEDLMAMDRPDASSADREPHLSSEVNYQPKISSSVMNDALEIEPLSFEQRSAHQDNVSSSSLFQKPLLPDVETHIAEAPSFDRSGLVDDVASTAVPQVVWSDRWRSEGNNAEVVGNSSRSLSPMSTLMRTPFIPQHESAVASIPDYDFEYVGSPDRQPHVITRTAPTVSATTPTPISAIPVDVSPPREGNEGDAYEAPNRHTAEASVQDSDSEQESIPSEVEPSFHRLEKANAEIAHPTADSNSKQNQLLAEESPGYDHSPGFANITKLRPLRSLLPLEGPTVGMAPSDGMLHRPNSWMTSELADTSETPPIATIRHVHPDDDSDGINFDEDDVYSLPYSEGAEGHSTETPRTKGLEAATFSVLRGNPVPNQDGEAADESEPVSIDEYSSDFGAGHTDMEEEHVATDDDDEIVFSDNDLSFDHGGTDDEADSVVG